MMSTVIQQLYTHGVIQKMRTPEVEKGVFSEHYQTKRLQPN